MNLCEYGCGQEATHQFKNGKWCCSENHRKCSEVIKKRTIKIKENVHPKYFGEELCSYGCNLIAKYKFNNGKLCCSESPNQCIINIEKSKIGRKGIIYQKRSKEIKQPDIYFGIELCGFGCNQIAKYKFNNGNLCCSKNVASCSGIKKIIGEKGKGRIPWNKDKTNIYSLETLEKMGRDKKGKEPWNKGKGEYLTKETREHSNKKKKGKLPWNTGKIDCFSKETKKKMSDSGKLTIEQIKEKYPTFSKEEEMRYNPDKPIEEKEIQVHCKNHNCENSKEKGGWFTPTYIQLYERIRQIENGNGGSYLYCSQYCKDTCPLYGLRDDPFKPSQEQAFRSQIWNEQVLKQDESTCQICGSKENLHCHHIRPVKLEPEYALDPSNGIVLCQTCHIKYGHKKGTECSHGNLAKIVCNKKGSFNENSTQAITT